MKRRKQSANPRVMLVDDQATQRLLVCESLSQGGFDVLEAKSGQEALALLATNDIAAMVVDVMMPDMDGFELCERVRADPRGRFMPIMMMTARNDEIAIEQAYNAGATDFMTKPASPLILNNRIRYMLRGAALLERMQRNDNLFGIAEEVAQSGSWEWNPGSGAIQCTSGFLKLFNVAPDTIWTLDTFRECVSELVVNRIEELAECKDCNDLPLTLAHESRDADGVVRRLETRVDRRVDIFGQNVLCCVTQDVTQRYAAEQEIRTLAYIDRLTGLPNRTLFTEHLRKMLASASRNRQRCALLHVDIDDFKRINKLADRSAGDDILQRISKRITQALRACDVVSRGASDELENVEHFVNEPLARLGGDEFIVAIGNIDEMMDTDTVCERIQSTIQQPFALDGRNYQLSACIGVAVFPDHGKGVEALLLSADTAVSDAKRQGKNRVQVYSSDIHDRIVGRLSIANDLKSALENEELDVFYQPRINIQQNQVVGMEALVRWPREGRFISPDEFIPVAEESHLINELGSFVLRRACEAVAAMRADGLPDLELGVNVSAMQLENTELVDQFSTIFTAAGLPPELICLELTESALMQDADDNVQILEKFREAGCKIAVDDFGTGYSSLNYLKRFPINTLKIDRSFVSGLATGSDDGTIVTAVIRLAQTLGLVVVAEGVETREQEVILKRLGCDEVQGFFYSKPLSYDDFTKWLRDRVAVSTVLRASI